MLRAGQREVDQLKIARFDLILMDIQMPEMDGLEASKMIRMLLGARPVIIAMTANTLQGDREACLQAGMDDYISKPIDIEDLVHMLEKWSLHIRKAESPVSVNGHKKLR